jgi:short-subunit dehydrogenase
MQRCALCERKVVVITGASRGIGAQLSKAYNWPEFPCKKVRRSL